MAIRMLCGSFKILSPELSDCKRLFTKGLWTGKLQSHQLGLTSQTDSRTPVWTAFITHLLGRQGWIRQAGSRTIIVRNLKPTIFMSAEDYNPPQTPRGEQILKFATRDGESITELCWI